MDVNAAVAAAAAIAGLCTGVIAVLAFRWSEREQKRPTRTSLRPDSNAPLPPGVDTVLSVLSSSAVVLDESDSVVKASSAAYALGLVRGGRLAVEPMLHMARDTRRDGEIRQGSWTCRAGARAAARPWPFPPGWLRWGHAWSCSWSRTSRRRAA